MARTKPLTKEQMRERKRRKAWEKNNCDPVYLKKPKLSSHIEQNKRGFLLPYNKGNFRQVASDTLQLLNKYADKLYRTNGKSCYFEEKLLQGAGPIFIESDIEDPSLLVDAILTDLRAGGEDVDVEKMKLVSRFLPVINTCTLDCEDIVESVKAVLEPLLAEKASGTAINSIRISLDGRLRQNPESRTKITDPIIEYLKSKGIQGCIKPGPNTSTSTYNSIPLIIITTCPNEFTAISDGFASDVCCITLTKNNHLNKGYYIDQHICQKHGLTDGPLIEQERTPMSLNKRGFLQERTPMSLNKRGFLLPWNRGNRGQIAIYTIQLLTYYADKLYRTNGKSCYFEDKLLRSKAGHFPVFIESDIEDPSLLVEAILTDLREGGKDIDVEMMKRIARFLPVINTCTKECEDILENVKAVIEPVLAEKASGTEIGRFFISTHGSLFQADEYRTKVMDLIIEYLASKGIQGTTSKREPYGKHLICLHTCSNGYAANSEGTTSDVCCITLTMNNRFKSHGYYVNKHICHKHGSADAPSTDEPPVEQEGTPVSLNKRGFLFPRNKGNRGQLAFDLLQLLNKYADKLYRTDGKTCYFEDKLLSKVGRSPIFIESDIEDPSLLVDAILTDMREGGKDIDAEMMKRLTRFLPVINTCTKECEDIIENVKAIIEPVLAEKESGTEIGCFFISLHGPIFQEDEYRTKVTDLIIEYLASKGIQGSDKKETYTKHLISLSTCSNGYTASSEETISDVCCITLTMNNGLAKGYYVDKHIFKKDDTIEVGAPQETELKGSPDAASKREPISPGRRGFFLSYKLKDESNHDEIASYAIQILNKYADKLYRSEEKSCYFEEKVVGGPKMSPIFIESDIDEPFLLVDAIMKDLDIGNEIIDLKKVKPWVELYPVNTICLVHNEEELLQHVKELVESIFRDLKHDGKIPTLKINGEGKLVSESNFSDKVLDYVALRREQEKLTLESDTTDVIKIKTFFKNIPRRDNKINWQTSNPLVCCMSLLKNYNWAKKGNTTISPGKRGFLLSYHLSYLQNYTQRQIASFAIQVLKEYADKRQSDKSCYFEERSVGRRDQSPIFIESDFADPSLLVDAIFKDLDAGNHSIDKEKVGSWIELFPVNTICKVHNEEELLQQVKELVEPVFKDPNNDGKIPMVKLHIDSKHVSESSCSDKVLGYMALRREQEKLALENGSTDVIKIKTFSKLKRDRSGGPTALNPVVCCMSLVRNFVALKNEDSTISSGKRGFLLHYVKDGNHNEIASNAIQLLNQYADKVYRTNDKSCYFEEKAIGGPTHSPIYIESDIDDSSLLVDAIFKDLQAGGQTIDIQNLKDWKDLCPVNITCVTDDEEEILQKVKELVDPIFRDVSNGGQIPELKVYVEGLGLIRNSGILDKILQYAKLRREQEDLALQSDTTDILKIRSYHQHKPGKISHTFKVSCISLMRKFIVPETVFNRYSFRSGLRARARGEKRAREKTSPTEQLKGQEVEHNQKEETTFDGPNLSINTRGFLVTWKGGKKKENDDYYKMVSDVIELLNEYADKIHRADGTSCHFEHKLINPVGAAPIFIETDLDDPAIIVDAYFADLLSDKCSGGKQLDPSLRFEPLNTTCQANSEDIIRNVKALLDLKSVSSKLKISDKNDVSNISEAGPDRTDNAKLTYKIDLNRPFLEPNQKKDFFAQIRVNLASRGVVLSNRKNFPDLLIKLRKYREFCCIGLLMNEEQQYKQYIKSKVVDKELTGKMEIDETLEDKEVNGKMETESVKIETVTKTKEVNEVTEAESIEVD